MQENLNTILYPGLIEELVDIVELNEENQVVGVIMSINISMLFLYSLATTIQLTRFKLATSIHKVKTLIWWADVLWIIVVSLLFALLRASISAT